MGALPVPVDMFFNDFAFDLLDYDVKRNGEIIATIKGLKNSDEDGDYIAFKMECDIKFGDALICGSRRHIIKLVDYDHYNGKPAMQKAYY